MAGFRDLIVIGSEVVMDREEESEHCNLRKTSSKKQRQNTVVAQTRDQLTSDEITEFRELIQTELERLIEVQMKQETYKEILGIIRIEQRLSFWQGVAVSLVLFIWSLFFVLIIKD